MEDNFTLNFYVLYRTPGKYIGVGVCDRDRIALNNHISEGSKIALGAY